MKSQQAWNNETGASLVAIMVSMAIFGIVAVMASQGFRNISVSGRRVEAAMSAREIENVILQSFVQRYKNYVGLSCPNNFTQQLLPPIDGLAFVSHRNVRFYNASYSNIVNPPETALTDVQRCSATPFSAVTPVNADTFYGCFDLATDPKIRNKASKDAFAANRGAFVEMYVKLRNLKTDTPTPCNQMAKDSGFGFEVYYALHWATPAGDAVMYDTKMGTFNAAY